MAKNTSTHSFTCGPEITAAIKALAEEEGRPLSQAIRIIVTLGVAQLNKRREK